jgi:hypothetical protein
MSASQRTSNMQLPLFVDSDKFERTDWNSAMNAIDGAVGSQLINIEHNNYVSDDGLSTYKAQIENCISKFRNAYTSKIATYGSGKVECSINVALPNTWGALLQVVPQAMRDQSVSLDSAYLGTGSLHNDSNKKCLNQLRIVNNTVSYYNETEYATGTTTSLENVATPTNSHTTFVVTWYIYR